MILKKRGSFILGSRILIFLYPTKYMSLKYIGQIQFIRNLIKGFNLISSKNPNSKRP